MMGDRQSIRARPSCRHFGSREQRVLLAALKQCRHGLIVAQRQAPPTGEVYHPAGTVIEAIDDLAEVDRRPRALHMPLNSSPTILDTRVRRPSRADNLGAE